MAYDRKTFLWQQTYATLFSVSNKLQIKGDTALGSMTIRQLMTIIAIVHIPKGEASLNRIAKKMGTTKQNIKQLVSALESKGYVKILASKADKRAYSVEISEEKWTAAEDCVTLGMNFLKEIFSGFSEEELEIFWSMLKKLYRFDGEEHDGFEEDGNAIY